MTTSLSSFAHRGTGKEDPLLPGVYRVTILYNGIEEGTGNQKLYSYYDGVDTWSNWTFDPKTALRARMNPGLRIVTWERT